MELENEDNDILLIKSSKAENTLLRDVLKASLEFDYVLWDGLEEEDVRRLIEMAEKRIEKEEFTITRDEFLALHGIIISAAYDVLPEDYGLPLQPVKDLMIGFHSSLKCLSDK